MKTFAQILMILLVAAVLAGALTMLVNNTSIVSTLSPGAQPPAIQSADGQAIQPMTPPAGEDYHHSASLTRGFTEVLITLAKLTGIGALVLIVQKSFNLLTRKRVARIA